MQKAVIVSKADMYIRNIIFGVEDSLVSTVGLLSGVAASEVPKGTILLTGVVLIFVEAFSMGIGSLLSEQSVEEYESHKEAALKDNVGGAAAMLFSYLLAGLVPLLPYAFFSIEEAFGISIIATLAALFILGAVSARVFKIRIIRHGLKMLLLGGFAILLGIVVGKLFGINA